MLGNMLLLLALISCVLCGPVRFDNIDSQTWVCMNPTLRGAITNVLNNTAVNNNVDEIQEQLEDQLSSFFQTSGGKWLVSVSGFHRVNGYVDDAAASLPTFCAINDPSISIHIVIVKVES